MFRFSALLLLASCGAAQDSARIVMDRAVDDFFAGRIAESVRGFDRVASLAPDATPHLWQRGIALYYAGRYADCQAQFESHRTVNPNDVENAAWHFLCVARAASAAKARAALLPVGEDARLPMKQVLDLFAGRATTADVLKAGARSESGTFYAHLYIALYAEATGDHAAALRHIRIAADPRYADAGGYMYQVARVHDQLRAKP